MKGIYSKNAEELVNKVDQLIQNQSENSKYLIPLKSWKSWYYKNRDKIILEQLENNLFYRAYYCDPNIYGIQIWEFNGELKIWRCNYIMNANDERNSQETTVIS